MTCGLPGGSIALSFTCLPILHVNERGRKPERCLLVGLQIMNMVYMALMNLCCGCHRCIYLMSKSWSSGMLHWGGTPVHGADLTLEIPHLLLEVGRHIQRCRQTRCLGLSSHLLIMQSSPHLRQFQCLQADSGRHEGPELCQ